jgi:hypothetical protein
MGGWLRGRKTRARRDQLASRESGQALLELALIVPILVLLLMAIFQFAYVLESQVGLTNAVREASRRAAATSSDAPAWSGPGSLAEWVQKQLCANTTPPCTGGLLEENVQGFDGTKLWLTPPSPVVTFCRYSAAGITNYRVQVDLKYMHPVFFGPLAFATDLVDGTSNGFWDLSASAQMRLENIDPAVAADPGACP